MPLLHMPRDSRAATADESLVRDTRTVPAEEVAVVGSSHSFEQLRSVERQERHSGSQLRQCIVIVAAKVVDGRVMTQFVDQKVNNVLGDAQVEEIRSEPSDIKDQY